MRFYCAFSFLLIFNNLFFTTELYAQKTRFLHLDAGLVSLAQRDFGYSPLLYKGTAGSFALTSYEETQSNSDYFYGGFSFGKVTNQYDRSMKTYSMNLVTYTFYHSRKGPAKGLHLGWSNNNKSDTRLHNDFSNFDGRTDYYTSFGPAFRYRLPFTLFKREFIFDQIGHYQILGFTILSSYITSLPPGFQDGESSTLKALIRSVRLFHPGSCVSTGFSSSLHYRIKTGNMLGLGYTYDYIKMKGAHLSVLSKGTWSFSLIVMI